MEKPEHDELIAYLDGELDPPTSQQVEQRLKSDPAYRQALTVYERSWDLLDRLPRSTVDENFTRSTLAMVSLAASQEQEQMPGSARFDRRRLGMMALVAAAALVLGYAGGRAIWPDPNRALLEDLPILEDLDLYEQAGSIDFLHKLADTGLFGDEAGQVKMTPGLAVPEATADRRAEVERMTAAEKEHLVRKLQRFGGYAWHEQQRMRQIYESLNHDGDGKELREVLVRYHEWLETLMSNVREALNDQPDDEQIAHIRQLKHEQAMRREQELKEAPTEQDLTTILSWFGEFASQNHEALLTTLSEPRRMYLESLDEEPRQRALLWIWISQHGGPGHLRFAQVRLTEADVSHLSEHLSSGSRARLAAAQEISDKRTLIIGWTQTAIWHRFETGRLRRMLPEVSIAELQRFAREELSTAQGDALAQIKTREKKYRELQWLYFLSEKRLGALTPEDIAAGGPAQISQRRGSQSRDAGPPRQAPAAGSE